MKKAVIVPAKTIGDALILMIVANHLKTLNYDVTIMHDNAISLKSWFLHYKFKKYSKNDLAIFDRIIYQHDNTKIKYINDLKQKNKDKFSIFYFTHKKSKHGPLSDLDVALSNDKPIAHSLALSCQKFFNLKNANLETGITIPKDLTFKKYPKRIILHPSSSDKKKCWTKIKFIKLAKKLVRLGFQVTISVAPYERNSWLFVRNMNIDLPLFLGIDNFAAYLYESAYLIGNDSFAVHLASLLNINHILIAGNKKLIKNMAARMEKI
jgi:hypothetical protein